MMEPAGQENSKETNPPNSVSKDLDLTTARARNPRDLLQSGSVEEILSRNRQVNTVLTGTSVPKLTTRFDVWHTGSLEISD
jgi:hypothetical protein